MTLAGHPWWLLPIDIVAWGIAHAATGYAAHRLPARMCDRDNRLTRIRHPDRTERRCRFFGVPRWKDSLPEAGAFFAGGVSKRHLTGTGNDALREFASLTRRAEMAHWMAFLVAPLFALWNPPSIASAHGRLRGAGERALHRHPALQPRAGTADPVATGGRERRAVARARLSGGLAAKLLAHEREQHAVRLAAVEVVDLVRFAQPVQRSPIIDRAGEPSMDVDVVHQHVQQRRTRQFHRRANTATCSR